MLLLVLSVLQLLPLVDRLRRESFFSATIVRKLFTHAR